MNWKSYLPIAAACVLGMVAAKIGWNYMSQRPVPVSAPAPVASTTSVVVLTKDVAAGDALHAADLALSEVPLGAAVGQTYNNVNDVIDRVPAVPLVKGQTVVETMLKPQGTLTGLSAVIPPGMRAITIDVNETTGVAGMILPGCHVDLVMTLNADATGPAMARTIADNVEILAIGRHYGSQNPAPPANGAPAPDQGNPRNVTLLVTPPQAHTVELAFKFGNPRFVLRGAQDTKPTPNAGVTLADLRTQSPEELMKDRMFASEHSSAGGPTTQSSEDFWSVRVIRAAAESVVHLPLDGELKAEKPAPAVAQPQKAASPGVVQNETSPAISR